MPFIRIQKSALPARTNAVRHRLRTTNGWSSRIGCSGLVWCIARTARACDPDRLVVPHHPPTCTRRRTTMSITDPDCRFTSSPLRGPRPLDYKARLWRQEQRLFQQWGARDDIEKCPRSRHYFMHKDTAEILCRNRCGLNTCLYCLRVRSGQYHRAISLAGLHCALAARPRWQQGTRRNLQASWGPGSRSYRPPGVLVQGSRPTPESPKDKTSTISNQKHGFRTLATA
jgi:hypothetical protein